MNVPLVGSMADARIGLIRMMIGVPGI